jgi:hypothetical protein
MNDEKHQNYGTVTGTPALVAGATSDGEQGLAFDGSTNSVSVPDSSSDSLTIADGDAGGMALVLFIKLAAYPVATKDIAVKAGSYSLQINSAGKLVYTVTNGVNSVTVTATSPLALGVWHHVAVVYNGDFTGTPQFGYATQGSTRTGIPGDYYKGAPTSSTTYNLQVCKFNALERGVLTGVVMDLQRTGDAALAEYIRAVVYADSGGAPGARIAQSADQRIFGLTYPRQWVTFPLSGAIHALPYHVGFEAGESSFIVVIGSEPSGGTRTFKRDQRSSDAGDSHPVGDAVDPFGTPAGTDAVKLSVYATYTPTGRTGAEGKALIYLNGREDASSAYAHGIADSANPLVFAANAAISIHKPAIFNRKLTPVEIAQLYSAR